MRKGPTRREKGQGITAKIRRVNEKIGEGIDEEKRHKSGIKESFGGCPHRKSEFVL